MGRSLGATHRTRKDAMVHHGDYVAGARLTVDQNAMVLKRVMPGHGFRRPSEGLIKAIKLHG